MPSFFTLNLFGLISTKLLTFYSEGKVSIQPVLFDSFELREFLEKYFVLKTSHFLSLLN
jgi:hypothetical protein